MIEIEQTEQTMQQRARSLVLDVQHGETTLKRCCVRLLELYVEFIARGQVEESGQVFTGFYDWMQFLGLSRGSAFNYLNAGYAIAAGLDDGSRSLTDLYSLGSALRHGATVAEASSAESPAALAEAKRNQGIVRLALPLVFQPEAEALMQRLIRLELAPARPEALGVAISICCKLSDDELELLINK